MHSCRIYALMLRGNVDGEPPCGEKPHRQHSKTTSIIVTHLENQQTTLKKVIDNNMSWAVGKQMYKKDIANFSVFWSAVRQYVIPLKRTQFTIFTI